MLISSCGLRLHWLLQRRHRHRRRNRRSSGEKVADDVALDPVLLVSGMGGSILNAKRKSNGKIELRVWVRIFLANLEFRKYIWSMYNPNTGVYLLISSLFRFQGRSSANVVCLCTLIPLKDCIFGCFSVWF